MSKTNLQAAQALLSKADSDWQTATIGLEHDGPLDAVCFHLQQTAEKLLKALMTSRGIEYPLTHDLRDLLVLAVSHFPQLDRFRESLPQYSVYAVAMRYDATMWPSVEETREAYETVRQLREMAAGLLPRE
jgi:HEPN domain-containing protein